MHCTCSDERFRLAGVFVRGCCVSAHQAEENQLSVKDEDEDWYQYVAGSESTSGGVCAWPR